MLIYDLGLPEITKTLRIWGEPNYRAKQIWQGLYQQLYNSSTQFSNLPKSLRDKLAHEFGRNEVRRTRMPGENIDDLGRGPLPAGINGLR